MKIKIISSSFFRMLALFLTAFLLLTGCATARPDNVENICSIFSQYPGWRQAAIETQSKWGISIPVQMAIIYHESAFDGKAKPPRKKILGIIPWKHITSASGYSQALNKTWKDYECQTGQSGNRRTFEDADDFLGWYSHQVHQKLGIPLSNSYALYLAYHEGPTGYTRRTYFKKIALIHLSQKVKRRAEIYERQLRRCPP